MTITGPLQPPQLERFNEDGFLIVKHVFNRREINEIAQAFDRLEARARQFRETTMYDGSQFVVEAIPNGGAEQIRIHRVVWCGAAEPVLSEFGRDPRLVSMAAQILGSPRMEQLINQAHFKLPGDDVAFDWHQDSRHRRYGTDLWRDVNGRGSFVQIAVAVDPMTEDNGPLKFIPGSQRLGHLPTDPETRALPDGSFDPAQAVTLTLSPGDAALFGPFVIHSSGPNCSTHSRRLFLNGFAYPGANSRVYPGRGAGRVVTAH